MTHTFARTILASVLLLAARTPAPGQQDEKAAVLAAVQQFFDAMAERDSAKALKVMLPEGRFHSMRAQSAGPAVLRSFTVQEDLAKWPARTEPVLERMWNAEVRIRGSIATVWTPYDFYRNGRFSHCGIDAFDLVRIGDAWKISGGVYTVELEGCAPSPLGPPPAQPAR